MEITCAQMDVLITFYIEGDLSKALKQKVEEHLKKCADCRTKYEIIKSMLNDLRCSVNNNIGEEQEAVSAQSAISQQYQVFKSNLSAYIDNELPSEENIKIKKFTISNKQARKELEDTYNIRRLMNNSFKKSKNELKPDFSRQVMKQLDLQDEKYLNFHPMLKYSFAFVITVLTLSAIVIFILSMS